MVQLMNRKLMDFERLGSAVFFTVLFAVLLGGIPTLVVYKDGGVVFGMDMEL